MPLPRLLSRKLARAQPRLGELAPLKFHRNARTLAASAPKAVLLYRSPIQSLRREIKAGIAANNEKLENVARLVIDRQKAVERAIREQQERQEQFSKGIYLKSLFVVISVVAVSTACLIVSFVTILLKHVRNQEQKREDLMD